jgi:HD-like signal output (HDOD) protein
MVDWKHLRVQLMGNTEQPVLPPRLEVPKLPQTVSAICQKANSRNCTPEDLSNVLEKDAALTVDLLKHVNSAATGLRMRAGTVRQAVALLGINKTRLFVITTVLEQHMRNTKSPLVLSHLFCLAAMERALISRELARATQRDTDLSFAAALIQDFILPSLTRQHLVEYAAFMKQLATGTDDLTRLEREKFGCSHADCAAHLMSNWGFPDDIICCALLHHRPAEVWQLSPLRPTALPAVAASSFLPCVLSPSPERLPQMSRYVAETFELELSSLAQTVDEQLKATVPDLRGYVTLHQKLEQLAASV